MTDWKAAYEAEFGERADLRQVECRLFKMGHASASAAAAETIARLVEALEPFAALNDDRLRIKVTTITFAGREDVGLELRLYHPAWTLLDHDWTNFLAWIGRAASTIASVKGEGER